MIYDPAHLMRLCRQYRLEPSKKYGQNFLIDKEPVDKVIEAAELSKSDTVIEIGPGFGVLTFELAQKCGQVHAFEIEKKLQAYWEKNCPDNTEIIWGNVLKSQLSSVNLRDYKVVANLPYQITSNAIRKFLETKDKPKLMVLMVQKEVAERICAKPGDMSLLSISVQYYALPQIVASVPRTNFWPQPKVDSAIIKLAVFIDRDKHGLNADEFFKLVKAGFASRRKFLLANLLSVFGKDKKEFLLSAFKTAGLDAKVRAQELSVEEWEKLYQIINLKS